jgi:hypothetical protein
MGASSAISTPPAWLYFARRTGAAGDAWACNLEQHSDLLAKTMRALMLLRLRQLDEGYDLLEEVRKRIQSDLQVPRSVQSVLERHYYGVSAYYFFCIADFEQAQEQLVFADKAVVAAVSESPFLLLLSVDCQEFCYHQARIADKRGFQSEMRGWVERAKYMAMNQFPLCITEAGQPVFFSSFTAFFESLQPLSGVERELERQFTDIDVRMDFLRTFVPRLTVSLDLIGS